MALLVCLVMVTTASAHRGGPGFRAGFHFSPAPFHSVLRLLFIPPPVAFRYVEPRAVVVESRKDTAIDLTDPYVYPDQRLCKGNWEWEVTSRHWICR